MALPQTKTGGSAPGAVAPGDSAGPAPAATVAGSGRPDKSFLPLRGIFGGKREPRSGADLAAEREKERQRKEKYRAGKRTTEVPPVLPVPVAPPGQPAAPAGGPLSPMAGGPAGNGVVPSAAVPGEGAPLVLWEGKDLAPVTDTAVPLFEEVLRNAKLVKLRKARVQPDQIKQMEKDMEWPRESKVMLSRTGAALGAKYLNKIGISAAYRDEVNFGMALLIILRSEAQINARLDKIIAAVEKTAAPANSAPAGPAAATSTTPTAPAAGRPGFPTDGLR